MRDIAVLILVLIGLGFTFRSAHYGVLLWSWLGYMNPHRLGWGFAYNFPFSQIVAGFTLVTLLFSKDDKRFPITGTTVIWILFLLWMCLTTIFALNPDAAVEQLIKIIKIQLLIFITLTLFKTRGRIDQLIWVIVISIGFFGVKGGIFTIQTGGNFRVWGPPGSFIQDNNELAVALLMTIPLMVYLRRYVEKKWAKLAFTFAIIFMLVSVVGSQSRGAFLAIAAITIYFWLKSRHKIQIGLGIILFAVLTFSFMPQSWHDRMDTIQNYEEDASARERIDSWTLAVRVANDRITGGGLNTWSKQVFNWYLPGAKPFAAHSIYFSVLGEHGWIGLFLFLLILFMSWRTASSLIRQYRKDPENKWIADLAEMIRISLLAFMSGGAFLSLSYFDLPWHLFAVLVVMKKFIPETIQANRKEEVAPAGAFQ